MKSSANRTLRRWIARAACLAAASAASAASAQSLTFEVFIPGDGLHGIHGLAAAPDGGLLVGSVVGQSIYAVDPATGATRVEVPPPLGMADDLAFGPGGQLVWTSFFLGKVHRRAPDGSIRELAAGLPGINSIAFAPDGRLFATQVFLGDALHEIDPRGERAPRKVLENLGGLNGFEFGPDGLLYGPLWFKGEVVTVDVDRAQVRTLARGFRIPAAVNFGPEGDLWVVDSAAGEVVRLNNESWEKMVVARLPAAIDNLAFDATGRLFVTVMAENAVFEIDRTTGAARQVRASALGAPSDLALWSDGPRTTLYVADTFAARAIDVATGQITDLARIAGSELEFPSGIDVDEDRVYLTSWFGGAVQTLDRRTGQILRTLHDFAGPYDVAALPDGSLIVAELAAGRLTRVGAGDEPPRHVLAEGLAAPTALTRGPDGVIYVTLSATGEVLAVDPAGKTTRRVTSGLNGPEGLAVGPSGEVIVVETGARRLTAIHPATGEARTLAERLPVGLAAPAGAPPPFVLSGVAVGPEGTVFISSDLEDAIYRARLQ